MCYAMGLLRNATPFLPTTNEALKASVLGIDQERNQEIPTRAEGATKPVIDTTKHSNLRSQTYAKAANRSRMKAREWLRTSRSREVLEVLLQTLFDSDTFAESRGHVRCVCKVGRG
jgi:hypothetical protein